jgi:hypothetical protein
MFKPTWLYVKQHSNTKLLYFGKTVSNPNKYTGSGKVWKRHLKIHGKEYVQTIWSKLFTSKDELSNFAIAFSEIFDIVESPMWANLIPENGIDGGAPGRIQSIETKNKIRNSINNRPNFNHLKGIPKSDSFKTNHSLLMKNRPQLRCCCILCRHDICINKLDAHQNGKHCLTKN